MVNGKIKWFNNAKGIGFLNTDAHNQDIFVHYSKISMEGYKTVNANQEVRVVVAEGAKGLYAEKVELV
jgi:CspA family cold shock protein